MLAHTLKSDSFKRINIFLQFVYVPQEISDEYTLRITHVEIQPHFTFKLFFSFCYYSIITFLHFLFFFQIIPCTNCWSLSNFQRIFIIIACMHTYPSIFLNIIFRVFRIISGLIIWSWITNRCAFLCVTTLSTSFFLSFCVDLRPPRHFSIHIGCADFISFHLGSYIGNIYGCSF